MKANSGRKFYIRGAITLAVVGVIAFGSLQFYKHQQGKQQERASSAYETLLMAAKQKDWKRVEIQAKQIKEQFPRSSYAALSSFMLARIAIDQDNFKIAIENLEFSIKAADKSHLGQIARLRLARVFTALEKYQDALAVLHSKSMQEGYRSLYEELKGDIYVKQKEIEKARSSYQAAINAAPPGVPLTGLQLKYADVKNDNLGES